MNWLLEPLTYQFMQRGLFASVIVGVLCAVMGTYVVLRGTRLARLNGNSAEDSQMPSKPFLAFEFQTDADAFS